MCTNRKRVLGGYWRVQAGRYQVRIGRYAWGGTHRGKCRSYAAPVPPTHPLFTRATEPACPNCGFSLKGLGPEGVCPECGTRYDPDTAFPLVPPSTLRALWYGSKPIVFGSVPAVGVIIALAAKPPEISEVAVILAAVALLAIALAFLSWSAWRGAILIDAIMSAQPRLREQRPAARALGCGATGILGIVGVLSLAGCAGLALLFGACVIGGTR